MNTLFAPIHSCIVTTLLLLGLAPGREAQAQTWAGTNQPGGGTLLPFTVPAGVTNFSLSVANTTTAFSHLYVKRGSTAAVTNYDFVARLNFTNNSVNLEGPELVAGTNYNVWVQTPTNSTAHAFTVQLTTNRSDARLGAMPIFKPMVFSVSGTLSSGASNIFQIDIPANLPGWRLVLTASGADPNIALQRGAIPGTSYLKQSVNRAVDTLFLDSNEATSHTYFVAITLPKTATGTASYTLSTELSAIVPLAWDSGATAAGSSVFTNQSLLGGDYFFTLTTSNANSGLWRTWLNLVSGEASLFLRRSSLPVPPNYPAPAICDLFSMQPGSDGVAMIQGAAYATNQWGNQFAINQLWYVMVIADPGSQWSLRSGNAYITPLPSPAADNRGGTNLTIGPEGMNFYRTTIGTNTIAWRLGLSGATNSLLVHKDTAAHPFSTATYEWLHPGQILLTPPYLKSDQEYFVTVVGAPGDSFTLDSRQQPIFDLPFGAATNIVATDYGYVTFRVPVPAQQIAWQLDLGTVTGRPSLAVRQADVANEYVNTAFTETNTSAFRTITLVPPTLTDGTYYLTVYGSLPFTATLSNSQPVITDVPFAFAVTNDLPGRAGWRFYRVTDIDAQLGTLGWELFLQNKAPSTEIALRRNAAPGRWTSRNNSLQSTALTVRSNIDFSSVKGYLQRPRQVADIWYVGINSATQALGSFHLTAQAMTSLPVALTATFATNTVTGQTAGLARYFQVVVPTNALGLEVQLINATGGDPRLVVGRDILPVDLRTILVNSNTWTPYASTTWPSGAQIGADKDWTGYSTASNGTNELGHFFFAGKGNPLEAGTYHIGIMSGTGPGSANAMSYELRVRGLFPETSFNDLAFSGTYLGDTLLPHDVSWHRVVVPTNTPSWKLHLETRSGDALLVMRTNGLPNYGAAGTSPANLAGSKLKKLGNEHFLLMPVSPATNIAAGTYYLGVVSEGKNPTTTATGSNSCSFTLTSEGALPLLDLGTVDPLGLTILSRAQAQEGGEILGFQLTVQSNTPVIEVRLNDRGGNPRLSLRADVQLATLPTDPYGFSGGWPATWSDDNLIRLSRPSAGIYTLLVQAASLSAGLYTNTTYTLEVAAQKPRLTPFDGGLVVITNQSSDTWEYFLVTVPADALGWDLRLTNITAGDPRLAVCRAVFPSDLTTHTVSGGAWSPWAATNWPSGAQVGSGNDWTGWTQSSSGSNAIGTVFMAAMGNPLEPGTYFVGVTSGTAGTTTNLMKYGLVSRGIGTNGTIPVASLSYSNGVANGNSQLPREATYYRVEVPTNSPSWEVRLGFSRGDGLLLVRKDGLPNFGAAQATANTNLAGCKLQKTNNEHFVLLPNQPSFTIPAGTYYLGVVSEGELPAGTRIGSNVCSYALESYGPVPLSDLGTVDPTSSSAIITPGALDGGELRAYQFSVVPGTLAVVVRLDGIVGAPSMTLRAGPVLPRTLDTYGRQGGWPEDWQSPTYIRLPSSVAGTYTLLIQAGLVASKYSPASYTLSVYSLISRTTPVAFNGGSVNVCGLASKEWNFFSVDVPQAALGWDLRLTNVTSGDPRLVICRGDFPVDLTTRLATGGAWTWNADTNWIVGSQIAPGLDWTGYGRDANLTSQTGRVFAVGMGNPLQPGSYYIGVSSGTGPGAANPMCFSIISRGIGGTNLIPVTPLGASNVTVTASGLGVREAAYYSLEILSNTPAWKLRLAPTTGEVLVAVQKDFLPNINAGTNVSAVLVAGGHKFNKPGNDHGLFGPPKDQTTVPPGTYYLAVVGEGQNVALGSNTAGFGPSDYALTRTSPVTPMDLGLVSGAGQDVLHTNYLENGESFTYQFRIPAGMESLVVSLETNYVGTPGVRLRADNKMALDTALYGQDGTNQGITIAYPYRQVISSPTAGVYSVTVVAMRPNQTYPDLTYTLRLHVEDPTPVLAFDGGSLSVTNQPLDLWRFFRVNVPAGAVGWDLRLTNVTNGNPRLVIRRDATPNSLTSANQLYSMASWTTGLQLVPELDWTGLNAADGSSSTGRVFQVGMGNPLEPGTYYVGVTNNRSAMPSSYTIVSRGIGAGYQVPVVDLAFDGSFAGQVLPAREAAWYRVTVPANCQSWKVALIVDVGESLLLAQRGAIPSISALTNNALATLNGGKAMHKPGNEHLLLLPVSSATSLVAGTYYLGVVSEGLNPSNAVARIGTGSADFLLRSAGELSPVNLGTVGDLLGQATLEGGEIATWQFSVPNGIGALEVSLEAQSNAPAMTLALGAFPPAATNRYGGDGGAVALLQSSSVVTLPNPVATNYSLTTQAGLLNDSIFKVRARSLPVGALNFDASLNGNGLLNTVVATLDDGHRAYYRIEVPETLEGKSVLGWKLSLGTLAGAPGVRVCKGLLPSDTGTNTSAYFTREAAFLPPFLSPGTWHVEIKATNSCYYVLTSQALRPAGVLNFDARLNTNGLSHSLSFMLEDAQRAYFQVEIPAMLEGRPVLGWKLNLGAAYGYPQMRVCPGALPTGTGVGTSAFFARQAVLVPEYLSPGTWYVEVLATGLCSNTLTSAALELVRPAWSMPAIGELVTTPGLPAQGSIFGDTGVSTNGIALPADQGTDLEQDSFHYYAVVVPPDNRGLLRTELDAISGNPNLYLRTNAPPTLSHNATGADGPLYNRALTNAVGTEYGNWTVLNGRTDTQLTPGIWYLAVHAAGGSNVRYRLFVSTGAISELPLAGGTLANQSLAAGDWRYYRVALPSAMPDQWTLNLARQSGEVVLYLRDTVPPGQGTQVAEYLDWSNDAKNHGPYPSFATNGDWLLNVPPVRPGAAYYIGVRAVKDSTFAISSWPGSTTTALNGLLAFPNGFVTNVIPAGGVLRYRIDVPGNARRWKHTAFYASTVRLFLDQGTLPTATSADHWSSSGANASLDRMLYNSSWPWLPGHPYYLMVTNTAATAQAFSFRMDGRDFVTDDSDNDGLPDSWELAWFGSTSTYGPNSDPDGDHQTNLQEYLAGTDPTSANSLRITGLRPLPDGSLELSIMGVGTNCIHRVLGSETLEPGSWDAWTNYLQVMPVQAVRVPVDTRYGKQFFQVMAPQEVTAQRLTPDSQVELTVIGVPKRVYRVLSSPALTPGVWTECYNYLQEMPVQVLRFAVETNAPAYLYRITAP